MTVYSYPIMEELFDTSTRFRNHVDVENTQKDRPMLSRTLHGLTDRGEWIELCAIDDSHDVDMLLEELLIDSLGNAKIGVIVGNVYIRTEKFSSFKICTPIGWKPHGT